jgi:hypothetical protein
VNLDDYIDQLREIARRLDQMPSGIWEALERLYEEPTDSLRQIVAWRRFQLVPADIARAEGYLPIGYLKSAETDTRIAFFTVAFEVGRELHLRYVRRTCEKYRQEHSIFLQKPELWRELRTTNAGDCDYELLSLRRFKQYLNTELVELDGWYFQLSHYLPPSIIAWTGERFPRAPVYARLNPYVCKRDRIIRLDCETVVPPNPNWWATSNLRRGQADGGSFCLQECPCTVENQTRFWEYQIKGLRKLEIYAIRRNNQNLSMMIEELAIEDGGGLLGRMIHLDSDCPAGTPADSCVLNHLDLAINYYLGDARQIRLEQDLSGGGKVVDASHRIHLFRVEGVPLSTVFEYADRYFQSKILKAEWRASQTRKRN